MGTVQQPSKRAGERTTTSIPSVDSPALMNDHDRFAEYPALRDTCYLDYAASPPVPLSILHSLSTAVSKDLYSNPHSRSYSSVLTTNAIDRIRDQVLEEMFGLSGPSRQDWDVVFTSGATAALKLVGDSYGWEGARYRYLKESHTSLVGVRGCALAQLGAEVVAMGAQEMEQLDGKEKETLFGYAAQCNATGARLGTTFGQELKRRHPESFVLLDAAAYLATTPLDLRSIPLETAPDFIACSFYKTFGYPTGLGALIVKRSSASRLSRRTYFGGGTIDAISTGSPFWSHPRRASPHLSTYPPIHDRFEDGTLPFLQIVALGKALDGIKVRGLARVARHAASLARLAREQFGLLVHPNGEPVVQQHLAFRNSRFLEDSGPIIGFTVRDSSGRAVGHVQLDRLATINGFQIRTGGLCNIGVVSTVMGLSDGEILEGYEKGRACWDEEEFGGDEETKPLGIARVSFGAASTVDDVHEFVAFIRRFYVAPPRLESWTSPVNPSSWTATLETLMLYPIKSCRGQAVTSWSLASTGLVYDREWAIVDATSGVALSQKRLPRMALICPVVDRASGTLRVSAEGMADLVLSLEAGKTSCTTQARVCGDIVDVISSTASADAWLSTFLGLDCILQRASSTSTRHGHFLHSPKPVPILLSNESPFLLISSSSVQQVTDWISESTPPNVDGDPPLSAPSINPACFRANFSYSSTLPPFVEDTVSTVTIGTETFSTLAPCRRCLMICVDQDKGTRTKSNEPFNCLARKRRNGRGRIEFGVHLMWREGEAVVSVGDPVSFSGAL